MNCLTSFHCLRELSFCSAHFAPLPRPSGRRAALITPHTPPQKPKQSGTSTPCICLPTLIGCCLLKNHFQNPAAISRASYYDTVLVSCASTRRHCHARCLNKPSGHSNPKACRPPAPAPTRPRGGLGRCAPRAQRSETNQSVLAQHGAGGPCIKA